MSALTYGMLVPIPPEHIDQVFLYVAMYLSALVNPAGLLFANNFMFLFLSFIVFTICLVTIVINSNQEDSSTQITLACIPVLDIIPMIRIAGWPVGTLVFLIIFLMALPINYFYIEHSEKFTDIYYDIYIIATLFFIVNWGMLWCHISYAIGKHKFLGVFMMIPFVNVLTLFYLAFGKGRRRRMFYRNPDDEASRRYRANLPRLR